MATMMGQELSQFHFLRPVAFWALIPLLLILILLWRRSLSSRSWRSVVDPQLLPYVLLGGDRHNPSWSLWVVALTGLLAVTALAGPAWRQLEQPVFRQQSALVIVLDLSRSMDANDIRPSRLERARLKLLDILRLRREGQTALIAYAASAFVVTPLTDDTRTIAEQLPSLTTDLMPAQGSRPDRALVQAGELLTQAGVARGDILLVTDGIAGVEEKALQHAVTTINNAGHRLFVLGMGTAGGAPIPASSGGFVSDEHGAIVVAKLDAAALQTLALQAHGLYQTMRVDDRDINTILSIIDSDNQSELATRTDDMMSDQWRDEGVWLLLPIILLASLSFRRGTLGAILLAGIMLPQSDPVMALEWASLWQTDDQRAQQALQQGRADEAANIFQDGQWRAAAQYRAGNYADALTELEGQDSFDAVYNRGNVLAQLQRLPEALETYEEALRLEPDNEDAQFNHELIKKALEQQQSSGEQPQQDQDDSQDGQAQENDEQQQSSGSRELQGAQESSEQGSQSSSSTGDMPMIDNADESTSQESGQEPHDTKTGETESDNQPEQEQTGAAPQQDADQSDEQTRQQAAQLNAEASEQQQATEQWLRRIPDDPGGLWRRKFLYQYQRQQHQGDEKQSW
jgi:Ca-activated chloride channel family protein